MRFTKKVLCVTCAPSSMNLQWRMPLFKPEFTTWVGLPTYNHYILPFTSAYWLSTQLDFKTMSSHWSLQYSQSTKQWSYHWCTMMSLLVVFKSVSFSQYVPRNYPFPVDCSETKHDWKSHVLCVYLPRMCRRKWNEMEFTTQAVHKMFRVRL